MAPEPSEHPPAPLVRRLLLHALEPSRHADFPLPVRLPTRQFLPLPIHHYQRRQAAGPLLPFHADFAGGRALQIRERLRPVFVLGARASDDVVRAVGVGGRGDVARCAEGYAGDVAVASFRVRLPPEEREPVYGAAFVSVQAQAG